MKSPRSESAARILTIALVFGLWTGGCDRSPPNGPAGQSPTATTGLIDPELVVAEDRLGPIRFQDLDQFILAMPANRRLPDESGQREWYREIARRVSFSRLMHSQALADNAEQSEDFRRRARTIERTAYSDEFLAQGPPVASITDDMIRARYEERQAELDRPERRRVLNIFKRTDSDTTAEEARAQAEELRQRALQGENFELLAKAHSDSESRHDGGVLGFISRGRFPADFDDIVFSLEPGAPSEVVETREGAHLFLVTNILPARTLDLEDARALILQELQAEAGLEHLRETADRLTPPEGSLTPSREQLAQLLRSGDPEAPVLRIGDFSLTTQQLQQEVEDLTRRLGPRQVAHLPFKILDELRCRELIYRDLVADPTFPKPARRIATETERQLVDFYVQKKLRDSVAADEELVRSHYNDNRMRYSRPLLVRLERLSVPISDQATEDMAELEEARFALDSGELDLGLMAEILGGRVQEIGPLGHRQLQATDRRALQFAFTLKPGEHSPPYQLGKFIVLFRVIERFEPEPLPFARVLDRVIDDLIDARGVELFNGLMERTLAEGSFEVYEPSLAQLG